MRAVYRYDPDTCTYVKVEKDTKYYLKSLGVWTMVVLILSVVGAGVYIYFWDSKETKWVKKQNAELVEQTRVYAAAADTVAQKLDTLKERDKNLYRTILNAEPIAEKEEKDASEGARRVAPLDADALTSKLQALDQKLNSQSEAQSVLRELARKNKNEMQRIPAVRPIDSEIISGFGKRKSPVTKANKHHDGVDFRANIGMPVSATADGVVAQTGERNNGNGLSLSLNHSFGYVSSYACLSRVTVRPGQKVKRGDVIAYTGNSGLSKGPHLHYEILKNGVAVDPIDYFYGDFTPEAFMRIKEKASQYNESMD